ncbi:MAG TPA: YdeI/OmpD-associated family protein [Candidatus Angelobacter sp.]|nr:YdeI/OmpD-associated family protein [Candidatus Angelobacter sp.]
MATPKAIKKTFDAFLERGGDALNWTIVRVPVDVAKVWGVRGQLKVTGQINGFPFRTSLFPTGKGSHILMVNKKMQAGAKVQPGMKAKIVLQPDLTPREVRMPAELERVLKQSKPLRRFYDSFNYSMRAFMAKWVGEGKKPETRRRRADEMAERLMLTLEAEHELPPILQVEFNRNPMARSGWQSMPPGHRRSHLMGIFYYKSPEARARRLEKAVREMVAYARKKQDDSSGDKVED